MNQALLEKLIENLEELNTNIEMFNREVFTARQAAKYLGIGYDTILRLTRIGQIEHVANGTNYLYKKDYLDRWLEKNKREVV
ncbi:helix-turn-helix domain-containing protein [Tissierella praeacuta]|uniref:helix-turn-helix domain-containing protein n=1 Tax=Tissierella praeacuta TaxID=43131 RepID=UPI00333EACF2